MSKSLAVIFDMDGVIVDSNPAHKIALQQFARKHGYDLDEKQLREKVYGRTNKEWITNLFGQLPAETLQQYAWEKEALYREIFKNDIKPVKGLVKFLDLLESHSIRKAIGTSAPRVNVDFSLGSTNLEKYFTVILDDTFVSHSKPDPEIYIKAAAALDLPNERCIVIEDSLSGVTAGKRAGSKVIGITTTHTAEELEEADMIIADFDDLTLEKLKELIG